MRDHKRGDSFSRTFQINSPTGQDWTGWTGKSQVRAFYEDGELLSELQFTWADQTTGLFTVFVKDTSHWPVGAHVFDVQLSHPDFVFSTATEKFNTVANVTKDQL